MAPGVLLEAELEALRARLGMPRALPAVLERLPRELRIRGVPL